MLNSSQMMRLKLPDYLADHHLWMWLLSGPRPHPLTHTQRLCVSLLLLLGHAAVNAAIASQMEDRVGRGSPPPAGSCVLPIASASSYRLTWAWSECLLSP